MRMTAVSALFMFAIAVMRMASAQSPIARFMYEDAERLFADGNYHDALVKLSQAEGELGKVNPPILYLRIVARTELLRSAGDGYDFGDVELVRQDIDRFFQDYSATPSLTAKLREVYEISEFLKKFPATRSEFDQIAQRQREAEAQAAEDVAEKRRADEERARRLKSNWGMYSELIGEYRATDNLGWCLSWQWKEEDVTLVETWHSGDCTNVDRTFTITRDSASGTLMAAYDGIAFNIGEKPWDGKLLADGSVLWTQPNSRTAMKMSVAPGGVYEWRSAKVKDGVIVKLREPYSWARMKPVQAQ